MTLRMAASAEFFGTAALLSIIVGSGIMGEHLSQGNGAVALLANSIATGAGLYVLISLLGPVSGAHLNPLVTLMLYLERGCSALQLASYGFAQMAGAIVGVWVAHAMFGLDILEVGTKIRTGGGQWFSELVATCGLLATVWIAVRHGSKQIPALVGAYITAAYWFTASTSFANPAVTIARSLTDTFAGIAPSNVAGFICAQFAALVLACASVKFLTSPSTAASLTNK